MVVLIILGGDINTDHRLLRVYTGLDPVLRSQAPVILLSKLVTTPVAVDNLLHLSQQVVDQILPQLVAKSGSQI